MIFLIPFRGDRGRYGMFTSSSESSRIIKRPRLIPIGFASMPLIRVIWEKE